MSVNDTLLNIVVIFIFILIGGVFAAAEMALVSLRDSQVRQLAQRSKSGRTVARLSENPNRFLSAVQIGVTLAGFLSAAFGGATLADDLGPALAQVLPISEAVGGTIALVVVTIIISYVSIVVGELTAKRLALQRAESFALVLGPLVDFIARLVRPVIWLLGISTDGLVRLLGGDPKAAREEVTDEEIRAMVSTSVTLGPEERQIVEDVFSAGDRGLREVMVPRTEVDFLPGEMTVHRAVRETVDAPRSRYPVTGRSADDILGFIHVRDLFHSDPGGRSGPVRELVRPVLSLPETVRVLHALTTMRRESAHLAIVVDEYGGTAGIVTMEDLVEELVGDITDEYDVVTERPADNGGEVMIDGLTTLDDFADRFDLALPDGPYDTVAGFVVSRLGRLAKVGDLLVVTGEVNESDDEDEDVEPARFELRVAELGGRRVTAVAVRRLEEPGTPAEPGPAEPIDERRPGIEPGSPDAAAGA